MKYKRKNIFGKLYSSYLYKKIDLEGNVFAFTLIELLVGVSISVMLMVSVSVFVTGGMKNILDEKKVIDNSADFNVFSSNLQEVFNNTGSGKFIKIIGGSGVLFKRGQSFDKGGFSYIGETSMDKFYCMSGSESTITKHVIIKTFVPFEENGENMFGSTLGSYDKIFTGSISGYTSYALDHVVKNSAGSIIIGKGIYGGPLPNPPPRGEGISGTGIYLNNPTGLALSGNILFISDTLNNRVLYYNITTKKIYKLLDEFDGLLEPTGLLYKNNKLYISNSGRGEILEYSSPIIPSNPTLTMSGFSVNNVNNFEIDFFTGVTLTGPYSTGAYNFTGLSSFEDFATGSTNKLKYYFSDYINQVSTTGNIYMSSGCNPSLSYYLNGNIPNKKIITCITSNTGSTVIKDGNRSVNFINSNEISISGISSNFTNTGSYYVDLKLFNGTILKYQKYFPYFTQGDGDILTPGDNTLKVFKSGLKYPTGLWWSGGNLQYNEFNKVGRSYDFQNTSYNEISDYILKTPLRSLSVNKIGNLLTLFLKYNKNYNCYNLDEYSLRSYVLKKVF